MPHETEILANESGIQYTGVNDASSVTGEYPIQGLMTGIFKRGRFDRPMTIHKSNIKAMLGFEPKNPYYNAVQDALETGVPSVQVLRVKGGKFSCTPNKVIIPASTWQWDRVNGLSMLCELWINGELDRVDRVQLNQANCQNYFNVVGQFTADQILLNAVFFYSGSDLYRQSGFGVRYFADAVSGKGQYLGLGYELASGNYLPLDDHNFYLQGYPSINADDGNFGRDRKWYKISYELRFKVDSALPSGYVDLVKQLWGNEPPTLFSCARYEHILS